ncbi:MAG: polysaccharide deacetylase family protein [Lachnospiraceae bacterium]|nr:polysaccharide deacetylase family protein [Lachnospiraceae bacterium]
MQNFLSENYRFISKILYVLALCLAALALNRQLAFYNAGSAALASAAAPEASGDVKRAAITFDDGPHPVYTEPLLDGLKERGVHATFFVTGQNAELHPDILKRMYDEGHLIGNHTYSHIQLTKNNRVEFKQELVKTNEILQGITGAEVQYVRPPYGSWDKSLESELNMFPILWNIDPLDWCTMNAECVAQAVIDNVSENDIILMHDYYKTSVEAALIVIDELQKQGYEFVTVDKLLFD